MALKQLTISREEAWEAPKGLLGLPIELRTLIYECVLLDPPKWDRHHKATCKFCPRDTRSHEIPIFDCFEECVCTLERACDCGLRQGLNLLLVNRQIHAEAAPIFWGQNTFLFQEAAQFAKDVGENLRPAYRAMLGHVSILGTYIDDWQEPYLAHCFMEGAHMGTTAMWEVLTRCEGLKTLEMGCEKVWAPEWYFDDYADDYWSNEGAEPAPRNYSHHLLKLREFLPTLKEFAFAMMWLYDGNPETAFRAGWDADGRGAEEELPDHLMEKLKFRRRLLYAKARQVLDLSKLNTVEAVEQAVEDFKKEFVTKLQRELETRLLLEDPDDYPTDEDDRRLTTWHVPQGLTYDRHSNCFVELADGDMAKVRLFGLPPPRKTVLQQAKERRAENAKRKKAGRPTFQEDKAYSAVKERKKKEKAQKKMEEEELDRHLRRLVLKNRLLEREEHDWQKTEEELRVEMEERIEQEGRNRMIKEVRRLERRKRAKRKRLEDLLDLEA
jgi:hypothetical protein